MPANMKPAAAPVASATVSRTLLPVIWISFRLLFRLLDCGGNDLGIAAEPLGLLDELAALDLENLHPAAALVVLRGDLERRNQALEGEIVYLFEALLDILAGRLPAARCLDRIADRLDVKRRVEDCTVVDHRVVHPLWRLLALRLVHGLDFLADRIVVAGTGECQRVIALCHWPATGRQDIGLGRGPDEAHHL